MNTLHSIFSHYYALPFGAALFIARRKWLAIFGAAFAPLALWTGSGDGAPLIHALLVVLAVTGALVSGTRTRAILLALPKRKRTAVVTIAACTAGIALLPGLGAAELEHAAQGATIELRQWQMRPPAPACMVRKYPVTISGATFYLPPAPVITIRAGRHSHHFQFSADVRALCAAFQDGGQPIHAENINFDFSIPVRDTFCQTANSPWGQLLCDPKTGTAHDDFPDMANLYSPDEYDKQHTLTAYSHADFLAALEKARQENHPFETQPSGAFDRYANGYWVARAGAWKNDAGEPFTLRCEESAQPATLSCTVSYRLKSGPQLTYHFSAPADRVEASARKIDRNFHMMIAEVSAP